MSKYVLLHKRFICSHIQQKDGFYICGNAYLVMDLQYNSKLIIKIKTRKYNTMVMGYALHISCVI